MTIFRKKLLPLLLVSCIGASATHVGTCQAGWADLVKPGTYVNFFKNHKALTSVGVMVLGCALVFAVYKVLTRNSITNNAKDSKKNEKDISNLAQACKDNDLQKAKAILEHNKDLENLDKLILYDNGIDSCNIGENAPLYLSCKHANLELVQELIGILFGKGENFSFKKFSIESITESGKLDLILNLEPLFKASIENEKKDIGSQIFEYLYQTILKNGKLSVGKNIFNYNVYLKNIVCEYGRLDMLKYLVKEGDMVTKSNLEIAVKNGHLDIVKYLFSEEYGKAECENFEKYRASCGKKEMVFKKTFDKNTFEKDNIQSFAHLAIGKGYFDMFKYFVNEHNVSIYEKDLENRSMFEKALLLIEKESNKFIKFLAESSYEQFDDLVYSEKDGFSYFSEEGDADEIKKKLELKGAKNITIVKPSTKKSTKYEKYRMINFTL